MPRASVSPTFLFDEPDRSLDVENQIMLWRFLRSFAAGGKAQFIVACHTPFVLDLPEAHQIEMTPRFLDLFRKVRDLQIGFQREAVYPLPPSRSVPVPAVPLAAPTTAKAKKKAKAKA